MTQRGSSACWISSSVACLLPETERYGEESFDRFHGHSRPLSTAPLAPNGQRYLSPEAELFKLQATRTDIAFKGIMEAELLVLMAAHDQR